MSIYLNKKPITTEQARDKLGAKGKKMTNEQINDILNMVRFICNKSIDEVIDGKMSYEN